MNRRQRKKLAKKAGLTIEPLLLRISKESLFRALESRALESTSGRLKFYSSDSGTTTFVTAQPFGVRVIDDAENL